MKIKIVIIFSFMFCYFINANAQKQEPIEKEWIKEDSVFINKVAKAYRANPLSIEYLLSYKKERKKNLGFGYYEVKGSNGKGYVSLFYDFIYYRNKLVAYSIKPQMPYDNRLINTYSKLYANLFVMNQNSIPQTLYFGYELMTEPIDLIYKGLIKDKDIMLYMTPFSDTMYGRFGGDAALLPNRANYNRIKRKLTPEICNVLLYSKNPATRLTAIEFYYQNPKIFKSYKINLEKRINTIFNELPIVQTMAADVVITEDSKKLVKELANQH